MVSKCILEQSHTLLWCQELKYHPIWKHYSFKKLDCEYPPYHLPLGLITEVEIDLFKEQEKFVLPFFIGSQFGVFPIVKEVFEGISDPMLIGILRKSMFSGCVSGLSIGIWHEGGFREIELFKN